eukprot:7851009-Lingulodinium_polyedra.AAC.1
MRRRPTHPGTAPWRRTGRGRRSTADLGAGSMERCGCGLPSQGRISGDARRRAGGSGTYGIP